MKKMFLENLGTKAMAVVLALLLWVYLYNESTDTVELDVPFSPIMKALDLASIEFFDADHRPIASDGKISLRITGPKGDLRPLIKKGLRCEPVLEPAAFQALGPAEFQRSLTRDDLNLPDNFTVVFRPDRPITIRYVRYVEREVRLRVSDKDYVGRLAPGAEVRSLSVYPEKIKMKVSADKDLKEVGIKKVPVENRVDSFVQEDWLVDDSSVIPLTKFRVEVRIEIKRISKDFDVPLFLSGPSKIVSRLELQTNVIKVQVSGPQNKVDNVTPDRLYAFVIVDLSEAEVAPANAGQKKILTNIRAIVLQESLKSLDVVVMPDLKPENRQVEAKVH